MDYPINAGRFIIGGDGELKDTEYKIINKVGKAKQDTTITLGAEMKIAFEALNAPAPQGPVARVSLVQIVQDNIVVQAANGAVLQHANVGFNLVQVNDGTADNGTRIDQDFYNPAATAIINKDPRYAQKRLTVNEKLVTQDPKKGDVKVSPGIDGDRSSGSASPGYAGERLSGAKFSFSMLRDQPTVTLRTTVGNADTAAGNMQFEIAVLFEAAGATPAQWGGSISWGWSLNVGVVTLNPVAVVNPAGVSARFQKAINVWNLAQIADPANHNNPVPLLPLP